MLSSYAYSWIHFWARLRACEDALDSHMNSIRARGLLGDPASVPLPQELANDVMDILDGMFPEARRLGLHSTLATMTQLVELTHAYYTIHQGFVPTTADVHRRVTELRERVEQELRDRLFLYVPRQRAVLHDQEQLFGPAVAQKFRRASLHIRESGSCLALSRFTAAVFHLMCALEAALDALAFAVGLPESQRNWQQIIQAIEARIHDVAMGKSQAPPGWDKSWYSDIAVEFSHFKEAWRNHVNHGRVHYTEEDASHIFEHVRAFMQKLATRLHERP